MTTANVLAALDYYTLWDNVPPSNPKFIDPVPPNLIRHLW